MINGKKVLFSGMQATGNLTLGNYLGALKNWVNLCEEYECFYSVVDLHSITVRQDPAELRKRARNLLTLYIAAGIDPEKVLRKYVDRVRHVHLKDLRKSVAEQSRKEKWSFLKGVREGTFTVPGDGDVDFAPIFKILEEAGYEGWVVVEAEQDPAKANPLEYAIKARKFISEKTGL